MLLCVMCIHVLKFLLIQAHKLYLATLGCQSMASYWKVQFYFFKVRIYHTSKTYTYMCMIKKKITDFKLSEMYAHYQVFFHNYLPPVPVLLHKTCTSSTLDYELFPFPFVVMTIVRICSMYVLVLEGKFMHWALD